MRCELVAALLHRPAILFLDEPTIGLDAVSKLALRAFLKEENRKHGVTMVLTTHDMDEVEKICDRVGIVCRGKLVALDSPLALKTAHTERKADVILRNGERHTFDMEVEADRQKLAEVIRADEAASVKTREFDFHATFLKLTGQAFE